MTSKLNKKQQIIEVMPYDLSWPAQFQAEKNLIAPIFGDNLVNLYHIGSTAIPGLSAKPTIDMLLIVHDINAVDACNTPLSTVGYEAWGEYGIQGRRFFLKGEAKRTHHLHAFQIDNHHDINRHLNVRDFLIAHPEIAKAYEALKIALANEYVHNRRAYYLGKEAMVKNIEQHAINWSQK